MPDLRRVNLDLRPEAAKAYESIHVKRGHNMTEAVNKSLVLYDALTGYIDEGGNILITFENGREVMVKII